MISWGVCTSEVEALVAVFGGRYGLVHWLRIAAAILPPSFRQRGSEPPLRQEAGNPSDNDQFYCASREIFLFVSL